MKRLFNYIAAQVGKIIIRLLLMTCKWEVEGLDCFCNLASKEKCLLLFWHNRLAIAPFILTTLAPQFTYTAFVSNSRDGDILSKVIHSFKCGKTIRVSHNNRHQALRTLIRHLKNENDVIVITPDGPRGPCYEMKPGAAFAAAESGAHVVPFNWTASKYWCLNTWDALRLPRPFSKIKITFEPSLQFKNSSVETVHTTLALRMQQLN